MIAWLGRAGGAELAVIALLGTVVAFGGGVWTGVEWEQGAEAKRQEKQEDKLDTQSATVEVDTDKIADALNSKIQDRTQTRSVVNTQAIADAARQQGVIEGRSAGYRKGFEDASNIPNTCYNDPRFLSDSLRVGAESRYRAVSGSPPDSEPAAGRTELSGGPVDNAPNYPTE